MLTTTRDMVLPTAITGSYPRPLWYNANLNGGSFKSAMGDSLFREQYLVCRLLLEKKKSNDEASASRSGSAARIAMMGAGGGHESQSRNRLPAWMRCPRNFYRG